MTAIGKAGIWARFKGIYSTDLKTNMSQSDHIVHICLIYFAMIFVIYNII